MCVHGVAQVDLSRTFVNKSLTPFDPWEHDDESQEAKLCELQELWATSKGFASNSVHKKLVSSSKTSRRNIFQQGVYTEIQNK